MLVFAQNHGTNRVALQVQCETVGRDTILGCGKFQHLALHYVGQTMDAADAIGNGYDRTFVAHIRANAQALDTGLDQIRNLCGIELHDSFLLS